MQKKICKECKKRFTRQWNLKRHLKDIHNISDHGENEIVKQKYDRPTYSSLSQTNNEYFRNSENKMSEMNYNPNRPEYHNFTNRFGSDRNYINEVYQNYELSSVDKKEQKLTIQDGIRIQKALQILKNVLPRFYPNNIVIRAIFYLRYQCNTKHSDQPLKDFYKKYHIRHLWPS